VSLAMRILLDTNVFILREADEVLDEETQTLMRSLASSKIEALVHPSSIRDLKNDPDPVRQEKMLSKIAAYPMLESPPDPKNDGAYLSKIGLVLGVSPSVDDYILYAVYRNAVVFLVTEDRGIHRKARRLGIDERVLSVGDAVVVVSRELLKGRAISPPALKTEKMHNLNLEDHFFDSFRVDYPEFNNWWEEKSREGRECWVHYAPDGGIGALLVYKFEDEMVDSIPPLPKKRRLKLCSFKVSYVGHRIGELLVRLATDYCVRNSIFEMYFTYFRKETDDELVQLVSEYGFNKQGMSQRGEEQYLKELVVENHESLSPLEIARIYYPSYYDGPKVNKFIVPIRPEFHDRLFTDGPRRQTTVEEHLGEFIVEGNTIKKAYLGHSRNKELKESDLVVFYRSGDLRSLTHLGIVESIHRLPGHEEEQISGLVGNRTVYSQREIKEIARKPTMVILFRQHFRLPSPLPFEAARELGILRGAPQSVTRVSDSEYSKIKSGGGIDERFAVH
jgi:rRNA-processing protein FCF1